MEKLQDLLVLILMIIGASCSLNYGVDAKPQVPCYFIFGDSLVDSGNNNNLNTAAKVNYPPYGIDFPDGPTGRFTNGRTTADIIGELLGFDHYIPSFLTATGPQILQGVNYASGSAGIRYESGKFQGENIELNKQLQNHQVTISSIRDMLGSSESATKHLSQCFYSVVIGSNDYINNYFGPSSYYTSRKQYTPIQFAQLLLDEYTQHIMTLHKSGARKVALTGIGPIGCTPNATAAFERDGSLCVDYMNDAVDLFNDGLKSLVTKLNKDFTDSKFVYLNTYGLIFSRYPASPGIELGIAGCCPVNEYGQCIPNKPSCRLRDLRLFWDSFHPTEFANKVGALPSYLALRSIL